MNTYENEHVRIAARYFAKADALRAKAKTCLFLRDKAQDTAEEAKTLFLQTFSDEHAHAFSRASEQARVAVLVASAVAEFGGPLAARLSILHTPEVYSVLAAGFEERGDAIKNSIAPLRKALGTLRAELTEQGMASPHIEFSPEVLRLRSRIATLESALQAASEAAIFCRRSPLSFTRSADQLFAELTAPLPVELEAVSA